MTSCPFSHAFFFLFSSFLFSLYALFYPLFYPSSSSCLSTFYFLSHRPLVFLPSPSSFSSSSVMTWRALKNRKNISQCFLPSVEKFSCEFFLLTCNWIVLCLFLSAKYRSAPPMSVCCLLFTCILPLHVFFLFLLFFLLLFLSCYTGLYYFVVMYLILYCIYESFCFMDVSLILNHLLVD